MVSANPHGSTLCPFKSLGTNTLNPAHKSAQLAGIAPATAEPTEGNGVHGNRSNGSYPSEHPRTQARTKRVDRSGRGAVERVTADYLQPDPRGPAADDSNDRRLAARARRIGSRSPLPTAGASCIGRPRLLRPAAPVPPIEHASSRPALLQ